MAAKYPTSNPSFTTKVDAETIAPEHMNDVQNEIVAIGTALLTGLAHVVKPGTDAARDLGEAAKRWRDLFLSRNATIGGTLGVTGASTLSGLVTAGAGINVTGTVAATAFTGDGSGLTGVVAVDTAAVPAGTIVMTGRSTAPSGWLLCDGSAVDRTTYSALFGAIGETYGVGDGSTTFNLPDLRGRFPLGLAASGTGSALAETGGSLDHTHTVAAHTHSAGTLSVDAHSHGAGTLAVASHSHGAGTLATASGGSHSHTVDSHSHSAGSLATASAGAHTHTISLDSGNEGGASSARVISSTTSSNGSHTHTMSGSTGSSSPGTNSAGSHTHSLSGSTASASPSLSGNTASVQPALSGSTGSEGGTDTGEANPPYVVVNYLIKE